MVAELTPNAIELLNSGATSQEYVLQVYDSKLVGNAAATAAQERFRVVLSDGKWCQWAMVATQMNSVMKLGVSKGTIIRLKESICNTVQNKRYWFRPSCLYRFLQFRPARSG